VGTALRAFAQPYDALNDLILRSVRRTRLEGWPHTLRPVAVLRDARKKRAPQDEVQSEEYLYFFDC
jgi:hypothetical protein